MLVKSHFLKHPVTIYTIKQEQNYLGKTEKEQKQIWQGFSHTKTKSALNFVNLDNDVYEEILNNVSEVRLFWLRYNADLKKNMYVKYNGKFYVIKQIENVEEKFHTHLLITIGEENE